MRGCQVAYDFNIYYQDTLSIHTDPMTVDVTGLDNFQSTLTLVTPAPVRGDAKVEFALPQPLLTNSDLNITLPQPFKTESSVDITLPQPFKAEGKAEVDIKPLELDQCLHVRLGPLPETCVRLPYQQRLAFRIFGVELFSLEIEGESRALVEAPQERPRVAWGGTSSGHGAPAREAPATDGSMGGGLRIRLGR